MTIAAAATDDWMMAAMSLSLPVADRVKSSAKGDAGQEGEDDGDGQDAALELGLG